MAASDFVGKAFVVTQFHAGRVSHDSNDNAYAWHNVGDVCFIIDAGAFDSWSFGITCLYASGISTIYATDDEAGAFGRWLREIK